MDRVPPLTRRELGSGAAAALGLAGAARAQTDALAGGRLYADVKRYSALGPHRTGTAGDTATGVWLKGELARAGYAAQTQAFDYPVFELGACDVAAGGGRISALPAWTPAPTAPAGATGRLSEAPGAGDVALVALPYNPGASLRLPGYMDPLTAAAQSGAKAVVAVTRNPVGELTALNAVAFAPAWPVPVVLVAGREEDRLRGLAQAGEPATVRAIGQTTTRPALNVFGRRRGRGKLVVLSTPKSGWLTCAGERGAGMAIWLGLARWLASETDRALLALTTSGHELDGHGGRVFLEAHAPKPQDLAVWVHIGANVAAYDFALRGGRLTRLDRPPERRGVACSASVLPVVTGAFAGQPGYSAPSDIDRETAPGEVVIYQRMGYHPIIGLVGAHPLHHTPRDLPDVTGPELLEPVARALQSVLRSI